LLPGVLTDKLCWRAVTMARASLTNGQSLHAVNDLFVGPRSHTSARYEIVLASGARCSPRAG